MNVYKFRVILDTEEDVFRDIEIATNSHFELFSNAILRAFGFEGQEMASFYMSNENWDKGKEIPLLDMGMADEGDKNAWVMANVPIESMITSQNEKILYVYDFLRMWCFYIELLGESEASPEMLYPRLALSFGEAPAEDSKEMDLLMDFSAIDQGSPKKESTGDPELDAYLAEDEEDEGEQFSSLDDLDEDLI